MDKQTLSSYKNTILGWLLTVLISIAGSSMASSSAAKTDSAVIKQRQDNLENEVADLKTLYRSDVKDIKESMSKIVYFQNDMVSAQNNIKISIAVLAATKQDK